jgi:hypothetical protein
MLTLGVTISYLGVSAIHLKEGRKVLALASLGYSLAATGMILAEKNSS